MKEYNIVVSFRTAGGQKEKINELLSGNGRVNFLKEVPAENKNSVLSSADILIAWNPLSEMKNADKKIFERLKFVQLLSAGFDHINVDQFPHDCVIASNNGAYAEPMAEHVTAMILAMYKNLLPQHRSMTEGKFDQLVESRALKNSVCGIIGFGGIGKTTAKLLKPFGVKIYAVNTSGKTGEEVNFIGTLNNLDYVLSNSDIIVLSLPLNESTKGLISKRELELMKSDGMIINVARGPIIEEKDLFNHLKNNKNFLAGTDVWWNEPFINGTFKLNYPFFELPNFLGSPHNSAVVPGALLNGAELAIRNVINFIEGKEVSGIINK